MTDREKLIEILMNTPSPEVIVMGQRCGKALATMDFIADHLIANGVTVPKTGRWIINSSGSGKNATNWAECSECHVCGSPHWKVCPVCETKMEDC